MAQRLTQTHTVPEMPLLHQFLTAVYNPLNEKCVWNDNSQVAPLAAMQEQAIPEESNERKFHPSHSFCNVVLYGWEAGFHSSIQIQS